MSRIEAWSSIASSRACSASDSRPRASARSRRRSAWSDQVAGLAERSRIGASRSKRLRARSPPPGFSAARPSAAAMAARPRKARSACKVEAASDRSAAVHHEGARRPLRSRRTSRDVSQPSAAIEAASRSAATAGSVASRCGPTLVAGTPDPSRISAARRASSSQRRTTTRISSGATPASIRAVTSRVRISPSPSPRGPPRRASPSTERSPVSGGSAAKRPRSISESDVGPSGSPSSSSNSSLVRASQSGPTAGSSGSPVQGRVISVRSAAPAAHSMARSCGFDGATGSRIATSGGRPSFVSGSVRAAHEASPAASSA